MYILFDVSQGGLSNNFTARQQAAWVERLVETELSLWSMKYDIPYRSKNVKGVKRVTFEQDEHYSFFVMSWNPNLKLPKKYYDYELIEPMKLD